VHDIGLPIVFAPYVTVAAPLADIVARAVPPRLMQRARLNRAVLYRHLLSLAMIGLTVALAGMMFETFIDLGASPSASLATSLLLTLSPPLLIFSVLFFTELLSALLCLLVFRAVTLLDMRGPVRWSALGVVTGFLFLVHARNIGLIVPLAALALHTLRSRDRRREAVAFGIALALMIAVRTAVNYHFWGALLSGPHARLAGWPGLTDALREMGVRTAGLLVDQEFGLLPYAPVYLFALAGFVVLYKARRTLALSALLVVGFYVALIICPLTNVHGWTGGWNPSGRFLTPILPLLGIGVVAGLRSTPGPPLLAIAGLQIVINVYAWQHPKILWNDGDGRAAFCEITRSTVCRYLPSLSRSAQVN
jgi:hypothetical protein